MSSPNVTSKEVEAKVAIRDAGHARRVLASLGMPASLEGVDEPAHGTYYDTQSRALLAAGYGFRVRRLPRGGAEATLKALGTADAAGVTTREEHTVPLPHARPTPSLLPEGPVRSTLEAIVGDAPLTVLARVVGRRRRYDLAPVPGLRVLVTHDRTRLSAGGRSKTDQEIEIELAEGPEVAFSAWVSPALRRARARPSRESKLERALRVGRVPVPSPARIAAARLGLRPSPRPEAPASEALAHALGRLSTALARAMDSARHGSVEGIHDLRTSSRRLKAVLEAHDAEISKSDRKALRKALRALRRSAGPARDLDVFRELLLAAEVPAAEKSGLAALRAATAARRGAARKKLNQALQQPELGNLADRVAAVATSTLGRPAPAYAIAGASRLPAALEGALAAHAALPVPPSEAASDALHALRIAVKHARYAAETFAPAFGAPVARYAEALRALQDELGLVQDARMARDALRALVASQPPEGRPGDLAVAAAATVTKALDRRAAKARARLDARANDVFSAAALRALFAHLGKRTGKATRARRG